MAQKRKALYWIADMVPTDDERAEAKALGITAFRNASQVGDGTAGLERAELVAGLVPVGYKEMPGCHYATRPPPQAQQTEPVKGRGK